MTEKHFAEVTLPFGDNDYKFCLRWADVEGWEGQFNKSLYATFNEMVATRKAALADVKSIIHTGLIGGGISPVDALALVRRFVEGRPLSETQPVALAIMEAFLFGSDDYRKWTPAKVVRKAERAALKHMGVTA